MKIIQQIKARRKQLGLKQKDMRLRTGMEQQQYQRIENGGNPRLTTLELITEGLEAELILVPKGQLRAVKTFLTSLDKDGNLIEEKDSHEDPWAGILD